MMKSRPALKPGPQRTVASPAPVATKSAPAASSKLSQIQNQIQGRMQNKPQPMPGNMTPAPAGMGFSEGPIANPGFGAPTPAPAGMAMPMSAPNMMGAPAMKKGGKVPSASKRADGCAIKGKTRGKMV